MIRTSLAVVAVLAVALTLPSVARALDVKEAGEIEAEVADREKEVKAKYGNKSWRDMDSAERRAYQKDMDAARNDTLAKHETTNKEYEQTKLKMGKPGFEVMEEGRKSYKGKKKAAEDAKKKEAEEAANKGKKKDGEVKVQRGFDDKNPVMLDGKGPPAGEGQDSEHGKVIEVPQDGE